MNSAAPIQKHLAYWKASELRTWLLYYSATCHHCSGACAIHIMLGVRITQDEVDAAEQMLIDFCVLLHSQCTSNVTSCKVRSSLGPSLDTFPVWI